MLNSCVPSHWEVAHLASVHGGCPLRKFGGKVVGLLSIPVSHVHITVYGDTNVFLGFNFFFYFKASVRDTLAMCI